MSRRLDILFVKPGSQKQVYGELSAFKLTAIEPPIWSAILAGYLRGLGFEAAILDAEAENLSYVETAARVRELNPLVAAIMVSGHNPSASTMNMTGAGRIADLLSDKTSVVHTLLAGLHPSALPSLTMDEERAEFLCQGEGFVTLPALLEALKGANPDFSKVPGLWWRKDGQVQPGTLPPLLEDLDVLPLPAWDMLHMEHYRAHNWHCFDNIERRQPYGVLYTSLGCPFKCTFCCINALFGKNTIRYRGLDKVMEELDILVTRYGVRNIKIMDELFAMNEKRVIEFCDRIIARKYDLNFWAYARVNSVSQRMLAKMKEAGINWIAYGFESGSKRVLEDVTKGYRLDQVGQLVEMTYAEGLHICANFIFGLREDDYDSMQETMSLMQSINAEWSNIYSAMAYPGSKLYDLAVTQGLPLPKSWHGYSQYSPDCLPLPTKYLAGMQVLSFRDYAFDAYFKNPRYLHMIRAKFGEQTMHHIQGMTEKTLYREFSIV